MFVGLLMTFHTHMVLSDHIDFQMLHPDVRPIAKLCSGYDKERLVSYRGILSVQIGWDVDHQSLELDNDMVVVILWIVIIWHA